MSCQKEQQGKKDTMSATMQTREHQMHAVHAGETCEQVEADVKRAWDKVETLTAQVKILSASEADARKAKDENKRLVESLEAADRAHLATDDMLGEANAVIAATATAAALLPNADEAVAAAWRKATGKARGPVPADWREHVTGTAAERIAARLEAALEAILLTEAEEYTNGK